MLRESAARRSRPLTYFFFFPFDFEEPDGNTLATVLAIELATLATTPFCGLRFFAFAFDFAGALGAALGFVFVFALVFAEVLAITDSATPSPFA